MNVNQLAVWWGRGVLECGANTFYYWQWWNMSLRDRWIQKGVEYIHSSSTVPYKYHFWGCRMSVDDLSSNLAGLGYTLYHVISLLRNVNATILGFVHHIGHLHHHANAGTRGGNVTDLLNYSGIMSWIEIVVWPRVASHSEVRGYSVHGCWHK